MDGNADLGNTMTERFNVGGAMLLKLFGRREEEDRNFQAKAAVVRDLGVRISLVQRVFVAAMLLVPALATALVFGVGGNLVMSGTITVGTLVALSTLLVRLLGPLQGLSNVRIDVMTALVSFERVFELLDLPSMVQEKPGAVALPADAQRLQFDDVSFRYPRADEISLASLEVVARAEQRDNTEVLRGLSFVAEPGQMIALVGPSGAGKTTVTNLVARLYDVGVGRGAGRQPRPLWDVRDVALQSLEDTVGYVTQDAHMFHDTIRANLLYARPGADDAEHLGRARGRADRVPRARRCPTASTPWSATAATGSPAVSASGSRSRGCCSRRPHRGPRRGHRPPRQRVRGRRPARPRRRPGGSHVPGDRPPALHGARRRPDPGARRRPGRPVGHPRRAARRRAASTPTCTPRSSGRPTPARRRPGVVSGTWTSTLQTVSSSSPAEPGGLGRATADVLVAEGARVVLSGRSQESLDAAVAELSEASGRDAAVAVEADNADPSTPSRLLDAADAGAGAASTAP